MNYGDFGEVPLLNHHLGWLLGGKRREIICPASYYSSPTHDFGVLPHPDTQDAIPILCSLRQSRATPKEKGKKNNSINFRVRFWTTINFTKKILTKN